MIDTVRTFWDKIGENDPYWGVLTHDKYRMDSDVDTDSFYASGKGRMDRVLNILKKYNASIDTQSVMDFGSGMGRLCVHVIDKCKKLYCVDISQSYMDRLNCYLTNEGYKNFEMVNYSDFYTTDFKDVNLIYSFITLQHNAPAVIKQIVGHMCNILNKGGIGVIGIPCHIDNWKYVDRKQGMQMNMVEMECIDNVIESNGCIVHDHIEEAMQNTISCTYVFGKGK